MCNKTLHCHLQCKIDLKQCGDKSDSNYGVGRLLIASGPINAKVWEFIKNRFLSRINLDNFYMCSFQNRIEIFFFPLYIFNFSSSLEENRPVGRFLLVLAWKGLSKNRRTLWALE